MIQDISFEIIVGGLLVALIPTLLTLAVFGTLYGLFFLFFTGVPTFLLGTVLAQLGTGQILGYSVAFFLIGIPSGAAFYSWFFKHRFEYTL